MANVGKPWKRVPSPLGTRKVKKASERIIIYSNIVHFGLFKSDFFTLRMPSKQLNKWFDGG